MGKNYYDYAKNDYDFIIATHKEGDAWNGVCSLSQKVCERFLKHLIDQYYMPDSDIQETEANDVMRTHNLNKLERFLKQNMDIYLDETTQNALKNVNGYYFETSYPGDESYFVEPEDVEKAIDSMKICKDFIDRYIKNKEAEFAEQEQDEI